MSFLFWGLIVGIILVDRWTKRKTIAILENKKDNKSVELVQNKLKLIIEEEKLKQLDGFQSGVSLIVKITLIILLCVVIYFIRLMQYQGDIGLKLALSFIIGGVFGNLIDRLGYGYVIDFICIKGTKDIAFNLSRVFILTGLILLIVNLI
ncbi:MULTISPECIES: signal peptidase II [Clostridium]|uniref:Lipoprotein signal peptidase (Prolipoprotein signalpeptidase) (Signal peptidase II) (SPase II) n=1 Tax=Clostridium novyi (strain NT) TaxID=386415 RepID=A0Q229_CLONN|nr:MULTISPECIES: signal peptidase II [Clostridium]ABK62323.1 Lipoprotein signal peptidase (Prolipoprotein signalpeptidase) (Signal peptidase II) (SPase II) [Clostridium novyi NT]KEH86200.1 peptidase A8 [Clostridium novyi A str. NCTC 538]KEH88484.1 peptidase A8 [Clostridium novyi A str. 4540]KEH90823.1 peptidase A8 [Clostridium botulinum C/D str. It1]KEH92481.1 peptidase A8 [Clostridium novyi A str. GD211209]